MFLDKKPKMEIAMKRFKTDSKNSSKNKKIFQPNNVELSAINSNCAGIDIGSRSHFVSIPPELNKETIREFSSTTAGVLKMCSWLKENKITSAAMESTGSYWIPVCEILEAQGIDGYLVDAKAVKHVPGRKTDVIDCQWIQKLHSLGLLPKAFRPKEYCLKLRALTRQHTSLIEHRSPHIQHMQKALHEMNIQLATHVRDITGVTGRNIIDAIINGERDMKAFALLVDRRCKKSPKEIAESLKGNYREEHLFALRQARDLYDYYSKLIGECEIEIEKALTELSKRKVNIQAIDKAEEIHDKKNVSQSMITKANKKNRFDFPVNALLETISGVDIIQIPGIDQITALKFLAEIGGNIDAWKSSKNFSSWMGLCPGNKISGGKNLSGKTKRCANKCANLLRMAANGLWNAKCYLGAFLRRMKGRLGGAKAITATAHKMSVILYTMIKERKSYLELGEEYYEKVYRERRLKGLQRQAQDMGFTLVQTMEN